MLTNNEIKDIIKAIRRLENRRIFLKETIEKVLSQEREVLCNFLVALVKGHLRLVKNVFKPIAKRVFIPLGLIAAVLAAYGLIQKKKKKDIMKIAKPLQ